MVLHRPLSDQRCQSIAIEPIVLHLPKKKKKPKKLETINGEREREREREREMKGVLGKVKWWEGGNGERWREGGGYRNGKWVPNWIFDR